MNNEESLRKATRIQFRSARAFIQAARGAATPSMKSELVKMAMACRVNYQSYRANLKVLP